MDAYPFTIGLNVKGDQINDVVPTRNTTLPIKKVSKLNTYEDDQTSIKIGIYEGEGKSIKDCNYLGQIIV